MLSEHGRFRVSKKLPIVKKQRQLRKQQKIPVIANPSATLAPSQRGLAQRKLCQGECRPCLGHSLRLCFRTATSLKEGGKIVAIRSLKYRNRLLRKAF